MSLVQEKKSEKISKINDVWSPSNPHIRAFIEVSYSDERRKEMRQSMEKNCSILISLLADQLKKEGAEKINIMVPADRKRFADIVYEIETDSKVNWEALRHSLIELGGENVGNVSAFIVKEK